MGFLLRYVANFRNTYFLSRLELALEECLGGIYYLGPLRAYPERNYAWSGAQPTDMGQTGASVVDADTGVDENGVRR